MAGATIAPFTTTISAFSISEGNSEVIALSIPSGTYVMGMSQIGYSISFTWSGINEAAAQVSAAFSIIDPSGNALASATSAETRTGKSGSATLTGTLPTTGDSPFVPPAAGTYTIRARISGKYSPGIGSTSYVSDVTRDIANGRFVEYAKPTISLFDVFRATSAGAKSDEGTYLRYSVNASIKKILSSDTGTFVLRHRQMGTSTWTSTTVGSGVESINITGAQLSGSFPLSSSYDVELVVTDRYSSVTSAKSIPTGTAVFHLKADKTGIGIGKYAETGNLLDVNMPARFRQQVTLDAGLTAALPIGSGGTGVKAASTGDVRMALGFGGLSFPIYIDVRLPIETYCHLPVNLYQGAYDSNVFTPVMINAATYNYAYQVNQAGFYLLAADLRADTSGSDSNTLAHTNLGAYVISSMSYLPTTSVNTVVGGVSATKLCSGLPTATYRKFNTYMSGCTSTSTTGEVTGVCYIPAGYYVVFMAYFRYSRKDIFSGNVGMALLR